VSIYRGLHLSKGPFHVQSSLFLVVSGSAFKMRRFQPLVQAHTLSAVHKSQFHIFTDTLHIW
jgi:hypothetical protein